MHLSVVIPAYNESNRLPGFLTRALCYLDAEFSGQCEIIVVDDGSNDDTAGNVEQLIEGQSSFRLIHHQVNRGKDAAVQTGMQMARGRLRLFVDADGSMPIEEERRLRGILEAGADVANGSRATREIRGAALLRGRLPRMETVNWQVRLHRHLMGRAFAALSKGIFGLSYADTQCGFKMFRGDVALDLFRV